VIEFNIWSDLYKCIRNILWKYHSTNIQKCRWRSLEWID